MVQTGIVMVFALLNMVLFARRAYPPRGWSWRLAVMVLVFALLGIADVWSNQGVGGRHDNGIGTGVHYLILTLTILIAVGTFVATFRAGRASRSADSTQDWRPASPPVGEPYHQTQL